MFRSGPVVQLKEAAERLAEVAGLDLTGLTEGEVTELVVVSQRAAAIAQAVHTAAVARLDITKAFDADGARSAARVGGVAMPGPVGAGTRHGAMWA